jgi:hypothetical protein
MGRVAPAATNALTGGDSDDDKRLSGIQVAAAYVYFFSLLLAVVFWGIDGFAANTEQLLKNLSSTLVGVVVGLLAVELNVPEN